MKNFLKIQFSFMFLILLSACMGSPDQKAVRKWVQEISQPCQGQVKEFTLIREGLLSNKFVGYAEVVVRQVSYYPDLVVYADDKNSFYKMDQNVCKLAELNSVLNR